MKNLNQIPDNIVNIVDAYGIDYRGNKNETKKIQKALNEISGSGKVLYFPPGTYKTFMLKFKSNIYLEKILEFLLTQLLCPYISDHLRKGLESFILIKDVKNLEISGLGIIDGNGTQDFI